MNRFYQAPAASRSALMIFIFLAMLLGLCNFFALSYRRKAKWMRWLNAVVFTVLFVLEAFMGQAFRCMREGLPCREALPLSMGALWGIAGGSFVLLAVEAVFLIRGRKRELHRDSVKQAMDNVSSAVCYFTPEGAVKLCNLQMHRLFRSLSGRDFKTLAELRRALDGEDIQNGVIRLSEERQTYLFPGGRAWHYAENTVTAADGVCYTEAIFHDVTELYAEGLKLKAQIKRLEEISRELKTLSRNAQTAAREQEILSAKTTLHDQMGSGVLAVRRMLQSGKTAEAAHAVEKLHKAVRIIMNDNETPLEAGELAELMHDADTIGVKVVLTGEMPKQAALAHAFLLAMRECMTNGVRHADANEMHVSMAQRENAAAMQITNNGAAPKSPIVPKGGLKNLERHISNLQGAMQLQSAPFFALTVTIPYPKEDASNEADTDR